MIELQPADFPQAAQNISAFISLDAVKCSALEGKQAGRVFGDDEQNFLVLHASGFCFVHLNDADHIPASVPQLLQKLKSERAWIGVLLSPALDHSIAERLMPRGYGERTRLAFTFARERFLGPPADIPAGFALKAIDAALYEAISIQFNMPGFFGDWADFAEFAAHGFGYCLCAPAAIAAVNISYSAIAADCKVELAVFTHKHYCGRGLATIVSAAAIDHCLRHDLLPEWSCHAENEASIRLAEKLGFARLSAYSVFVPKA